MPILLFGVDENSTQYSWTGKNLICFNSSGPIKHIIYMLNNIDIPALLSGLDMNDSLINSMVQFRDTFLEILSDSLDLFCNSKFINGQIVPRVSKTNTRNECGICNMRDIFNGYQYFTDSSDGSNCSNC